MIEYYDNVIEVVEEALDSIPTDIYEELVNECVDTIKNGGKVIASGLGKNVPICEKFVGTLNSFGIDARFLHTNTAVHGDLGMVSRKDLVILLSKGGNTVETVTLANHLKNRGTKTWLISFNDRGKAFEVVEKRLIMNLRDEGDMWNIVPNNSTTVYLMVLQGIAVEMAKRLGITLEEFKVNHPGGGIGAKLSGKDLWR